MRLWAAVLTLLRALGLAIAAAALLALLAIVLGIPTALGIPLIRFREPTWVLYGGLALFAVAHERPGTYLRELAARTQATLSAPSFFPAIAAASLALYLLVSFMTHLSFHTFSHDFSMFDEALYYSNHGRFLYTPVLGRGYLTEHFSPILGLLVPLHRFIPSAYLLVVVNALLLWVAVIPLRAVLDSLGVSTATRNLACLIYLTNPVTAAALDYGFHAEVFLPLAIFALYAAHRRGPAWVYWVLLAVALSIKEDMGLYILGLGAFLYVAEKRRLRGSITAVAGLAWVLVVLFVLNPRLTGGTGEYRFLSRWGAWGSGPVGILAGMATHPMALLLAAAAPTYVLFFYRLVFTPFIARWGWLFFLIPWLISATSASRQHATLGLYYGLPLLAFTGLAAAHGLATPRTRRVAAHTLGPMLAALAIMLNVAHFTIQPIPAERRPFLDALRHVPPLATIQAMPALYPTLGYERPRGVLMPGDRPVADYLVLRTSVTTWPFSQEEVEALAKGAMASWGYVEIFRQGSIRILARKGTR